MRSSTSSSDGGSAVAEFVLVAGILTLLFLAVLQIGLAAHVRTTLLSAAAEGARLGARADRSPDDGAALAAQLAEDSLPGRQSPSATAGLELVDGVETVVVDISARVPVTGLVGPSRTLHVVAHAVREGS